MPTIAIKAACIAYSQSMSRIMHVRAARPEAECSGTTMIDSTLASLFAQQAPTSAFKTLLC